MPRKSQMKLVTKILLSLCLMLPALPVMAQQDTVFYQAPYEVHYSTFNSSFLKPETAKAYGIVRSKSRALLNVAIIKRGTDGKKRAVSATVKGTTYDLILTKDLKFFEVREQDAIYYLAEFDIEHKLPFYFTVNVQADPNKSAMKIQFKKILWVDGRD